ncbi:MAG TPA: endonuclease [Flavobacterium sp.]|nr:endonuclease [Flavobacterium sp.]
MIKKIFLALVLLGSSVASAQVVINELDCDTAGTDDKEFIELKSATSNFSLDGYVLVFFNGTGSQANLSYFVYDLDGLVTDDNGIAVVGNALVSPVPGKLFADSVIQNGPDAIGLYLGNPSDFPNLTQASSTNLIDALAYGTSDPNATALMALLGVAVQADENINSLGTSQSIQRKNDGTYETKAPTPGANNDGTGIIYNGITISTTATQFGEGQSFNITFTTQTNVTGNVNFNFSLNNGTFDTADFSGTTSVTIPAGSNSAVATIQTTDDALDEGDEVAKIQINSLPAGYVRMNNNISIRILDNDFIPLAWGTPLNPTYGIVSNTAPAGYYDSLEGKSGAELRQALQDIIANPSVVHAHNYGDVTNIIKACDQNPLNPNQVWLLYSEQPRSKLDFQDTGGSNIGKWNREHMYPQSRGGYSGGTSSEADGIEVWLPTGPNDILTGHGDAHHIRAEDGPVNSSRNNKDYGEYLGPTGNVGSWHGDVARGVFYMAVRYNGLEVVNGNPPNTTVGQLGDLALLLQWNHSDPSDDFEMNRNNYIYTWQVNRNPFIDYPDLADYIWGTHVGDPWFAALATTTFSDREVVLYPNPAQDYFVLSGIKGQGALEIYDVSGSKLLRTDFIGETRFDLNLASGMYIAKISSGNKTTYRKLVIR